MYYLEGKFCYLGTTIYYLSKHDVVLRPQYIILRERDVILKPYDSIRYNPHKLSVEVLYWKKVHILYFGFVCKFRKKMQAKLIFGKYPRYFTT